MNHGDDDDQLMMIMVYDDWIFMWWLTNWWLLWNVLLYEFLRFFTISMISEYHILYVYDDVCLCFNY